MANSIIDAIEEMRKQKDNFFKTSPYSPLMPEQQMLFTQLNYFPPNPDLIMELTPEPYADQAHVRMQTSTGEVRSYIRWGRIRFPVDGQEVELTLFMTPGDQTFFIPFMDATSSSETYSGGRYLEAERMPNGKLHVDFNVAYSPYCAYNEPEILASKTGREPRMWSCPIPPKENRLSVAIRAGEKSPTGEWCIQEH
jgi:uncharacterized protein (DUF1684 family)